MGNLGNSIATVKLTVEKTDREGRSWLSQKPLKKNPDFQLTQVTPALLKCTCSLVAGVGCALGVHSVQVIEEAYLKCLIPSAMRIDQVGFDKP